MTQFSDFHTGWSIFWYLVHFINLNSEKKFNLFKKIIKMGKNGNSKVKIGITTGDINGIGMELILRIFTNRKIFDSCIPIVFGYQNLLGHYKKVLRIDLPIHRISTPREAKDGVLNCINVWNYDAHFQIGESTKESGICAFESLQAATKSLIRSEIDAMVTSPINKNNIQSSSFQFPGHTEYLESMLDGSSTMIMVGEDLKIALVTGHVSVNSISHQITKESIRKTALNMVQSLTIDFELPKPKIAVLSLNPHSGDGGVLGKEEDELIRPVIKELFEEGYYVFGPFAGDGFFGSKEYSKYDGVVAMYHDQGLIPYKLLSFGSGVNFTAGLSAVRTSPDHGVAYDLAGKGIASENSFRNAVFMAIDIFRRRQLYSIQYEPF